MPPSDQTRLLIVEDVPQVAQYIRGLLETQARVKLLEVLTDDTKRGELKKKVDELKGMVAPAKAETGEKPLEGGKE